MNKGLDEQVSDALALLPATGEVEFDAYKAQLQTQNPDNAKVVFTRILIGKLASRRLDLSGNTPVVYLSKKV